MNLISVQNILNYGQLQIIPAVFYEQNCRYHYRPESTAKGL
ncbi:MAG: hypothetical protein PHY21_06870 [Candidatus Cloacimonetes bacterium]|nr:hypothetical protein [Candidatus Cloacimonadota bacterium]MDD4666682.1 hypothetical protein [Candidatus Cloacimonadota bacterium]